MNLFTVPAHSHCIRINYIDKHNYKLHLFLNIPLFCFWFFSFFLLVFLAKTNYVQLNELRPQLGQTQTVYTITSSADG